MLPASAIRSYLPGALLYSALGAAFATLGGLLSFLAIGCPTCNKIIVLLLGASGALTIFEPLLPLLALASFALLLLAIWIRWRPVFVEPSAISRQPSVR